MKKFLLISVIFFTVILGFSALATVAVKDQTTVYFFYGQGCPHCADEKPFLDELEQKYPNLEIKRYEVWGNLENQKLFQDFIKAFNVGRAAVPMTFVGLEAPTIGYGDYENTGKFIEEKIVKCLEQGCADPISKVFPEQPGPTPTVLTAAGPEINEPENAADENNIIEDESLQETAQQLKPVEVYFFKSTGCPHCASLELYLGELQKEFPMLTVKTFDFRKSQAAIQLGQKMAESYGGNINAVPITFIGDKMIVGDKQAEVRQKIEQCLAIGCPSPLEQIDTNGDTDVNTSEEASAQTLAGWIVLGILSVVIIAFITIFFLKRGGK
jgi:thiol-disulfide isomerase/thioredoxin